MFNIWLFLVCLFFHNILCFFIMVHHMFCMCYLYLVLKEHSVSQVHDSQRLNMPVCICYCVYIVYIGFGCSFKYCCFEACLCIYVFYQLCDCVPIFCLFCVHINKIDDFHTKRGLSWHTHFSTFQIVIEMLKLDTFSYL